MASDENYDEERYGDQRNAQNRPSELTGDDVARATAASDDEMVYAGGREADDDWLGEGLASVLLVAGVVLFLFPEPATSMLGVLLVVAGLVAWIASAAR